MLLSSRRRLKWALAAAAILALPLAAAGWAGLFDRHALAVIPAQAPAPARYRAVAAVYLSGDVGLRIGLGDNLARRLATDGIPVVTVNSLAFFRRSKSLSQVTDLVERAVAAARKLRPGARVVVIGHSLGADALQAALAAMPETRRAGLAGAVLIVPTRQVYFRVSPAEMLDLGTPDADALPSLRRLTWLPLTCIHGTDEDDSPCRAVSGPNLTRIALPGGHLLRWDVGAVHAAVLRGIDTALRPAQLRLS